MSCGGTLAAWAAAGCEVHTPDLHRRGEGHGRSPRSTRPTSCGTAPPRRRPPPPSSGSPGQEHLGFPDGGLTDDEVFRGSAGGRGAAPPAGHRALSRPHGRLLRPGLLQPPGPPDHRVRRTRRRGAGRGHAPLLPGGRRRRTRCRRCCCRGPSSRTCGWTSPRRSTARARPWAATGASSPTARSGRPPPSAWRRRTPVARPGCRVPRGSGDCASGGATCRARPYPTRVPTRRPSGRRPNRRRSTG